MAKVRKEEAVGVVDGVNDTFQTTQDYSAGTVVAYINGIAQLGTTELGGKLFRLQAPPKAPGRVSVYYVTIV